MEDQKSEFYLDSSSTWARDHTAMNLAVFCPCLEDLSEARFQINDLIWPVEDFSKEDNTETKP